MQFEGNRPGFVGALVLPGDLLPLDQGRLDRLDCLLMVAVVGQLQIQNGGQPLCIRHQLTDRLSRGHRQFSGGRGRSAADIQAGGLGYRRCQGLAQGLLFGQSNNRKMIIRLDPVALMNLVEVPGHAGIFQGLQVPVDGSNLAAHLVGNGLGIPSTSALNQPQNLENPAHPIRLPCSTVTVRALFDRLGGRFATSLPLRIGSFLRHHSGLALLRPFTWLH